MPVEFASHVNLNEDESEIVTFVMQTRALLWKNYLLFTRKQRIVLFVVLTPLIVAALLEEIIKITKVLHNSGVAEWPVEPITEVKRCINKEYFNPRYDEPCITVGYSMIGDSEDINDPKYARYHEMMKMFAKQNNLNFDKDVKPLTAGK